MYDWLHRIWYEGAAGYRLLLPLAGLYWLAVELRRFLFRARVRQSCRPAVPVIVVGNVTVGGTGKTPVTIWLGGALRERGFRPGIVSRGYGGSKSAGPVRVDAASDPAIVGDEPVLLALRSGLPVVVDANRCRAAEMLVGEGCDVIIADDGLQHYRLGRDYEICVIDAARGLGNRRLLPAGPLREPIDRLAEVDQVIVNGRPPGGERLTDVEQNAIEFRLVASDAVKLDGSLTRPLSGFAGRTVHAVAAIGNPQRFFDMLRSLGIEVIEHPLPDHAGLSRADLDFADRFDILMTEKDAVKLRGVGDDRLWRVPVQMHIDAAIAGPWLEQLESRLRRERSPA